MTHRPNQAQTICYSDRYGYVKLVLGSTHSRFKSATYSTDDLRASKLDLPLFDGFIRKSGRILAAVVTLDVDNDIGSEMLENAAKNYIARNGLLPLFLSKSVSGKTKVHCGFGIANGEVSEDGSIFKVDLASKGAYVDFSELARLIAYELSIPESQLDLKGCSRCFCTESFLASMGHVKFTSPGLTTEVQAAWRSLPHTEAPAPCQATQEADCAPPSASQENEAMVESLTAIVQELAAVDGLSIEEAKLLWIFTRFMKAPEIDSGFEGSANVAWLAPKIAQAVIGVTQITYYRLIERLLKKGFLAELTSTWRWGKKSKRYEVLVNPFTCMDLSHSPACGTIEGFIDSHASGYSSGTFNDLEVKACVWAVHRNIPADQLLTAFHSIEGWGEPRRVRRLLGTYRWAQRKV
jgi:hypothetical protein